MEEEEKNKETDENSLSHKQNISVNENQISNNNNSEGFRHINHQKIKINEEKLKDSIEKTMEIKSDVNTIPNQNANDITAKNNPLTQSTFNFTDNRNYYLRVNRCLTARIKKIILIIFLVTSVCFMFISIFDIINSEKKTSFFNDNKYLMNNIFIFIIHIAYALSLLLFQGITFLLEPKENLVFNLASILLISTIIILRTVLAIKNDDKKITMILNFFCCFCLTFINLGIFLFTLKILKMKKNVQQNIEEIINFTDVLQATNSKINDKKDNQLMLNNSGENKENENNNSKQGVSALIEETNNNPNNSQPNIQKA